MFSLGANADLDLKEALASLAPSEISVAHHIQRREELHNGEFGRFRRKVDVDSETSLDEDDKKAINGFDLMRTARSVNSSNSLPNKEKEHVSVQEKNNSTKSALKPDEAAFIAGAKAAEKNKTHEKLVGSNGGEGEEDDDDDDDDDDEYGDGDDTANADYVCHKPVGKIAHDQAYEVEEYGEHVEGTECQNEADNERKEDEHIQCRYKKFNKGEHMRTRELDKDEASKQTRVS